MVAHKMYIVNNSDTPSCQHSRVIPCEVLGRSKRRHSSILGGNEKMTIAVWFHRCLFSIAVILAFFQGAINQGRADMLEKQNIELLIMMDMKQLTEVKIDV
jgi:hypothetical protein